jgi:endonuclease/exonuclease/phosphatase family metal-dependent hydrolase
LVIVYRTPYSAAHPVITGVFLEEFSEFLESVVFCANHLLITGDFNIHMDMADDADAIKLCELLESVGLQQHVTVPTHISKHTLDLIITRQSDPLGISVPWTDYLFSDHMPVTVSSRSASPPLEKHRSLSGK